MKRTRLTATATATVTNTLSKNLAALIRSLDVFTAFLISLKCWRAEAHYLYLPIMKECLAYKSIVSSQISKPSLSQHF